MVQTISVLSLEIGAFILYWLVIIVVETAILQLLSWGEFRECVRASLVMNLVSLMVTAISLILLRQFGLISLITGAGVSIFLETLVLNHLKPVGKKKSFISSLFANLATFLILILPLYWFVQ